MLLYWSDRLIDAFTKPPTRGKNIASLVVGDFGRHQIWVVVKDNWELARGREEVLIRPLGYREFTILDGTLLIGAVLKARGKQEIPGAIIGRRVDNRFDLMGIAVLDKALLSFRVQDGVLAESDREIILKERSGDRGLFPLSYETWIPIQKKLVRIFGVINE
jgi:hypothetical protein